MIRSARRVAMVYCSVALPLLAAPARLAAQDWTIDAVRYATIRAFPVAGLVVGAPRDERMDISMVFWLLRAGDRVVLFDTGFHHPEWMRQFEVADYVRPDSALLAAGVEPDAVTDVIISHAHWDHMGGIDLF
ncbi:MAG: MBL fold metallo-hydrolase, partial [Gemmatimonadota bacterium]